jgi:hypothetical protein
LNTKTKGLSVIAEGLNIETKALNVIAKQVNVMPEGELATPTGPNIKARRSSKTASLPNTAWELPIHHGGVPSVFDEMQGFVGRPSVVGRYFTGLIFVRQM